MEIRENLGIISLSEPLNLKLCWEIIRFRATPSYSFLGRRLFECLLNKLVNYIKIQAQKQILGHTSTCYNEKNNLMKKKIFIFLLILSALALIFRFGIPILAGFWENSKSGLKIISLPEADVFLDDKEMGRTPYENNDLKSGEYEVKLKTGENIWQGVVQTIPGTVSIVNREIASSIASSSGEILILKKGKGVFITSTPLGAKVEIGEKDYGKTPLLISDLTAGDYIFILSHPGYSKRQIRAVLPPEMILNINSDLAVAEANLGVSSNIPKISTEIKVTVKQTPTGFLRVRDKPSTLGKEVAKVFSGDSLILLEEGVWDKVRTIDGVEGYVSGIYIMK